VGVALPGYELRLAPDGELLSRGITTMKGYRHDPEKTAEAIDADGWMHTGDVATIDDGYVTIVDRKKELIINSGGKNMSPANIEAKLKSADLLIGQAVAIGDRRPYNVALIVLDPDACAAYAATNGLSSASPADLCHDPGVMAAVETAVARANDELSRIEPIKRHKILDVDWEPAGDELTPTSKLKRKPIAEKYAAVIDALYA
jgi:long-subunit acyl-CoA synthetase (AMP-forming)